MKTNSSPSRYRYCISRLSTLATSTLTPALNVRSTTLPLSTFFSLVRTNAPPLPGLTCWNSTTFQSWPSMLRVMPFLRSFVVATVVLLLHAGGTAASAAAPRGERLEDEQFPGDRGERLSRPRRPGACANHQRVLDPDAAAARQVNSGLDGDWNPVSQFTGPAVPDDRCLVDFQTHAVAEAVREMLVVAGVSDDVPGDRVHLRHVGSWPGGGHSGGLGLRHDQVNIPLPAGRLPD